MAKMRALIRRSAPALYVSPSHRITGRQPFGPWLLGTVALGFVAFGLYDAIRGILRRIELESPGEQESSTPKQRSAP
jgi:hypothetical protein